MKKSIVLAFSLLLAFGLSSCGDDNSGGSNKGNGGSSIVVPPGSITPSKPDTGNNGDGNQDGDGGGNQGGNGDGNQGGNGDGNQGGNGDGNQGGNGDGNQGGDGDGNQGGNGDGNQDGGDDGEKLPQPGDKCSADVCSGNQVLYCNLSYRVYVLDATCPSNMVCALRYNADKSNAYAGCYDTCTAAEVGQTTTSCQSNDDMSWTIPASCEASADNQYISIPNYQDTSAIMPCKGDCEAGKCKQLADDEGQPCDSSTYPMHCSGDALVLCANDIVTVSNCAKVDGTTTCAELNDSTTVITAACIDGNRNCKERLDRSYVCDDTRIDLTGKYNLIGYQCLLTTSGSLVAIRDEFFSDVYCGETCDAATGQCCDQETGICSFEEPDE